MKCPYCGNNASSVLESRIADDQTSMRRRRVCDSCTKRFTTYERVEGVDLVVVKKDGQREQFDREKIKKGLMKATWKRPVSMEEIEKILNDIEKKLRMRSSIEIKSWEIGNMIMKRLKKVDPISYMLFASVYKDFPDIESFEAELKKVKDANA